MKLIIDMEMQKFCLECACCDRPPDDPNERPSWCPICGVLPEEHGDLIDRSVLKKEISVLQDTSIIPWAKAREYAEITKISTLNIIDDQHAVIAAERKDE